MKKNINFKPEKGTRKKSEVMLILLVLLVGLNALMYKVFLSSRLEKYTETNEEIISLSEYHKNLKIKYLGYERLKSELVNMEFRKNRVLSELPKEIFQENILLGISEKAAKNKIALQSISMEENDDMDSYGSTSNFASTDREEDNESSKAYIGLQGVAVEFSGKIDSLYSFVRDVEKSHKMISMSDLNIMPGYAMELTGSLRLEYLSCLDGLMEEKEISLPEMFGKTNPFKPYNGYTGIYKDIGKGEILFEDDISDFVIQILDYQKDSPSYIMGPYDKLTKEIYSTKNGETEGNIEITEENGDIIVNYSFANKVRESVVYSDLKGPLSIHVYSRKRVEENDIQKLVIAIDNKTDKKVNVKVIGEDSENPLFEFKNIQNLDSSDIKEKSDS